MSIPIKNPYAMFASNPMKQSENISGSSAKISSEVQAAQTESPSSKSERSEAVQAFLDYMNKTPAERMQDAWLAEKGITEEDFENMTPDEKQSVLDEMRADIKRKLEEGLQPPEKRLSIFV